MTVRGFYLALAAVLCANAASAQTIAYAATLGTDLDSATQAAVTREVARARERGIPAEPLLAKVREGRLKRASGPSIRTAIARLAVRLDSARTALGPESTSDELIAGADAIAAGASGVSLRAIRAASSRSVAAPLGTLAQLVASGVAQHAAVEMIVALIRKNATPAQVLALGNLVEGDVAAGMPADESAAIRLRGIEMSSVGFGLSGDKVNIVQPTSTVTTPPATNPGTQPGTPKRRP